MANDEHQQLNVQNHDLIAKIQSSRKTVASRQEKLDKQKMQQRVKENGLNQQLKDLQS